MEIRPNGKSLKVLRTIDYSESDDKKQTLTKKNLSSLNITKMQTPEVYERNREYEDQNWKPSTMFRSIVPRLNFEHGMYAGQISMARNEPSR